MEYGEEVQTTESESINENIFDHQGKTYTYYQRHGVLFIK